MTNKNLKEARAGKKDEFYTQLTDIEKELVNYKDHFKNKVVLCNCDDPEESNFWKYFRLNFKHLGLKKLISTHFESDEPSYKLELIRTSKNKNGISQKTTPLRENGDFRGPECIELLRESDIVVTNPPFSLFREYIAQLIEYKKKFLIIGNMNAITYNETFSYIKEGKLWLGLNNGAKIYKMPDDYPLIGSAYMEDGKKYAKMGNTCWFTNLKHKKRNEEIILYKKYNPEEHPTYDNYNAINVDKVKDIPVDYDGEIGVPITFLTKHNPDQFEIIGLGNGRDNFTPTKDYISPYQIKMDGTKITGNAINRVLTIATKTKPKTTYYTSDNSDFLIAPYARILIKKK